MTVLELHRNADEMAWPVLCEYLQDLFSMLSQRAQNSLLMTTIEWIPFAQLTGTGRLVVTAAMQQVIELEVLQESAETRAREGLPPFGWDTELVRVANHRRPKPHEMN